MEEFDFKTLLKHLWSKAAIIFALFAVTVAAGEFYTFNLQVPKYKSTTKLVLTSENNNTNLTVSDVQISNNLVTTYSEIVKSENILSQVKNNLHLDDLTTEQLLKKMTVTTTTNTQLITVSVSDEDPKKAQEIAAEIAKVFKKEIEKIYNLDNVQIVDQASLADKPYNVSIVKQTIYYALAGLALGLGVALALFYLDTTIKDQETVEDKLGLTVIGNIPDMERK